MTKRMIFGVVGGIALSLGMVAARDLKTITSSGTIRIATEGAFPPFNDVKNGKFSGFEVELAEAISKKLGVKVVWSKTEFDSLLVTLQKDQSDLVIASHSITPEREKIVNFSQPHYCTGTVIVSKNVVLKNFKDLSGKIVGVASSSTQSKLVRTLPGLKGLISYKSEAESLAALKSGQVDATLNDFFGALYAIKSNPELKMSSRLVAEVVAMAVKKDNRSLLGAVNSALASLLKDGTYASISKKFFSQDIRCP
jgi:polar amino acid transport system substrate-binding protein